MTKRETQRAAILSFLQARIEAAKNHPEVTYDGYFRIIGLQDHICEVMGYEIKHDGWHGLHIFPRRLTKAEDVEECTTIISHLAAQGYIRLSKSGKAYKVLKAH